MTKRKLKGVNVNRLPKNKKDKMEKTLAKMDKIREDDNILLRDLLQTKLKFAVAERAKGLQAIEIHRNKIDLLKEQVLKLEGAIITIQGILNASTKKEELNGDKSNN